MFKIFSKDSLVCFNFEFETINIVNMACESSEMASLMSTSLSLSALFEFSPFFFGDLNAELYGFACLILIFL